MRLRSTLLSIALVALTAAAAAVAFGAPGDGKAAAAAADIERLPRAKRLGAYERALADERLTPQDRLELTRGFARHAATVSPVYGKGGFPFDEKKWIATLRRGFDADPRDPHVAHALAQLLIDRGEHQAALPVVKAFAEAHPKNHYALAWLAWCESRQGRASAAQKGRTKAELPAFGVHFCVLTRNPEAHRAATPAQCRKEVDILNATFRTLDAEPLVRFEFKGFAAYDDVKGSPSELLSFGDRTEKYDTELVAKAFNACKDRKVRDPQAINIYIYDSHSPKGGSADMTSHGKRNSNRPFVLIDWRRLNGAVQNAEAHEMGHCFGLEHVGVPGAGAKTSTNIMASAAEQFGSGGLRDLGFTPAQAAVIAYHAKRTQDRLRAAR
jgi:hypothetical protein